MVMPDVTGLPLRDQVTYWIGSVTRSGSAIEAIMRRVLRDLGGGGWDAPVEGEAAMFERVREQLKAAVRASALREKQADDVLLLLGDVSIANRARTVLVHSLWIEHVGEDVFQRANASLMPAEPPRTVADFREAARQAEVLVFRMQWLSGVLAMEQQRAEHPMAAFGWAMVRGEFDMRAEDWEVMPRDEELHRVALGE